MKWKRSKKAQQEAKAKDESEKRKTSAASCASTPMESKLKDASHDGELAGQQTASSRSVSPAATDGHTTSTVATATNLVLEQNFQAQGMGTRVHHLHHHHLQNHHRRLSVQDGGEALYRPYVVWTLPIVKLHTGLRKKSKGWWDWRLSIIPHSCLPSYHHPTSYLNHPEELIVEEVCHVAITTDIGMNTVATWLECNTGGQAEGRNVTCRGDVESFTHLNLFLGFSIDHRVATKWIIS